MASSAEMLLCFVCRRNASLFVCTRIATCLRSQEFDGVELILLLKNIKDFTFLGDMMMKSGAEREKAKNSSKKSVENCVVVGKTAKS
jgi:hypothetical protein